MIDMIPMVVLATISVIAILIIASVGSGQDVSIVPGSIWKSKQSPDSYMLVLKTVNDTFEGQLTTLVFIQSARKYQPAEFRLAFDANMFNDVFPNWYGSGQPTVIREFQFLDQYEYVKDY